MNYGVSRGSRLGLRLLGKHLRLRSRFSTDVKVVDASANKVATPAAVIPFLVISLLMHLGSRSAVDLPIADVSRL